MKCNRMPLLTAAIDGAVSCRAADRRWGAEAFLALQIPGTACPRHQSKGRVHFIGLTRNELPSLLQATEGRLSTRKPNIHAVVAVFSVVAVKNTITRTT